MHIREGGSPDLAEVRSDAEVNQQGAQQEISHNIYTYLEIRCSVADCDSTGLFWNLRLLATCCCVIVLMYFRCTGEDAGFRAAGDGLVFRCSFNHMSYII
jgi:hypothetical protein